jgi:pimeloyl-ACP methyl ester carboxylesterase
MPWARRSAEPVGRSSWVRLAGSFHVIAPDYPGYGYSQAKSPETYAYTFDHVAQSVDDLLSTLGISRYVLYAAWSGRYSRRYR